MNILLIVAGSIGIFIGVCLIFNSKNQSENLWLGLLLSELAFFIIVPSLTRLYPERFIHFIATTFPVLFLIGPTIWIYSRKLQNENLNYGKTLIHFVPSFLTILILLDFLLQSSEDKLKWLSFVRDEGLPLVYHIIWILACIHIFVYFVFAYKKFRNYQDFLEQNHSNLARINLKWISFFSIANAILWLSYLIIYVLFQLKVFHDSFGISDKLFALGLGVLICGIGYNVLNKPEIFSGYAPKSDEKKINSKYQKTGLTESLAQKKLSELLIVMKQKKPYLNPDLTLNELADIAGLSPKHLSQIINQCLDKKFYEFINEFRIKESKILLKKGDLKILGVAFESGFKSKSTFNYAFKKFVGETPSSFLKNQID